MAKIAQLIEGNYNILDNIPVINQDLTASGFTPVANTYYRHTGATTDTFTQGVIYLYDTTYHKLGESGGTKLNKYTLVVNGGNNGIAAEDINHIFRIKSKCKGDFKIYPDIGFTGKPYAMPIELDGSYIVLEYATVDGFKDINRWYYIFGPHAKGFRSYKTSFKNDNPTGVTTFSEGSYNQKLTIEYFNDTEIL